MEQRIESMGPEVSKQTDTYTLNQKRADVHIFTPRLHHLSSVKIIQTTRHRVASPASAPRPLRALAPRPRPRPLLGVGVRVVGGGFLLVSQWFSQSALFKKNCLLSHASLAFFTPHSFPP